MRAAVENHAWYTGDLLEEADDAHGQTAQARMHDAEAAMDAVRRKFGSAAAQFGA